MVAVTPVSFIIGLGACLAVYTFMNKKKGKEYNSWVVDSRLSSSRMKVIEADRNIGEGRIALWMRDSDGIVHPRVYKSWELVQDRVDAMSSSDSQKIYYYKEDHEMINDGKSQAREGLRRRIKRFEEEGRRTQKEIKRLGDDKNRLKFLLGQSESSKEQEIERRIAQAVGVEEARIVASTGGQQKR